MTRPRPVPRAADPGGFTLIELLIGMAIFIVLGGMAVFLMRRGLDLFSVGTRDAALQDRMDVVVPQLQRDLAMLTIPHRFDAPPPLPSDEASMFGEKPPSPPPVDERLRSGWVVMQDVPEGPLKNVPCRYVAFVASRWRDPALRQVKEGTGPEAKPFTPATVEAATDSTVFLPAGGLLEICYVAIPENESFPGVLTLYRGYRAPIGGPGSLLDPTNVDSMKEVQERCRPVARGLLHLGLLWRRVFSKDWEPTSGPVGETDPYVGEAWDSTRALDKTFPLFRGPDSLADPSDDVFPAWVRLEVTLVPPATTGFGRGDTSLLEDVDAELTKIPVEDARPFALPGPDERWLKVDSEWMRYRLERVDIPGRTILVERAQRGTTKAPHRAGAEVYVGTPSSIDVRLPVYRDRYARGREERLR